jgi:hypothetical protein
MDIKSKLDEIFNEAFGSLREVSPSHGKRFAASGRTHTEDAHRKRKERELEKRKKQLKGENEKSIKETGNPIHHPRSFLNDSPLKLTLKETFVNDLIEYVHTNKKSHLKDALSLMEEYPNLYKFVTETSRKCFNEKELSVYSTREHLNEEIGQKVTRPDGLRIGHLSIPHVETRHSNRAGYMILEAKISPDKILIYIPAFTKLMEELIYSGKIEEKTTNILRETKRHNEIILLPSVNEGVIVKINN